MRTFFVADLHFGDERYTRRGGDWARARPFADAAEMDEVLVDRWNDRVTAKDVVWVLGDIGRAHGLGKVAKLKGDKRLILGNCDPVGAILEAGLFSAVFSSKRIGRLLLTHIPVHPGELKVGDLNVHGHLHGRKLNDRRYVCVSVDQTGFGPIDLAAVVQRSVQGRRPNQS